MVVYEGVALQKRTDFIIRQINQESLKHKSILTILDIGCGTGSISQHLGFLRYKVLATDLDDKSIAECKLNNKYQNVEFIVADAKTMGLNKKFDVIITSEIIEHVEHPELVVKNMKRHLNEDGIWLVSIPNGYCLWEIVVSRFIQKNGLVNWLYNSPKLMKKITGTNTPFYSNNAFCFHVNFFTYGKFRELIENNGFKIITVKHSDLGILPEWKSFRWLKKIECGIANIVPHFMAGGWLMVIKNE